MRARARTRAALAPPLIAFEPATQGVPHLACARARCSAAPPALTERLRANAIVAAHQAAKRPRAAAARNDGHSTPPPRDRPTQWGKFRDSLLGQVTCVTRWAGARASS